MKKRLIVRSAALCMCAVLMNGLYAAAEEKRLGDLIYVPAMQVQQTGGMINLRVEGLALTGENGEPTLLPQLAGAEFGVYVISGSGKVTPWANPLYPSEPMRIRTGEGETRFSLPQGAEYYLRQESAPKGYIFDSETLIPVTGDEIVVRNEMPGQLVVTAADSLGEPVAGVSFTARDAQGNTHILTTDETGKAVLLSEKAQMIELAQQALPQGVFAAQSVLADGQAMDPAAVRVQVDMAERTEVSYVHPAAGTVHLAMHIDVIDDNAEMQSLPLSDVEMEISGALLSTPMTIVTDHEGQARASLMEGTYDVRLAYRGSEDVIMPLEYGQMVVSSGATTLVELSAFQPVGRVVVHAGRNQQIQDGSVTLRADNGKKYGPYLLDAEGIAVSDPLPAGVYTISEFKAPKGTQVGTATSGDLAAQRPQDLAIEVEAGQIVRADVELLTREKQEFALMAQQIDEKGEYAGTPIQENLKLELIDAQGEVVAQIDARGGKATVEALSGVYALRMDERKAAKLGVQQTSSLFVLPAQEEMVGFSSSQARVKIETVNSDGEPVSGAEYMITDSRGAQYRVTGDADGMAVSALLAPGEVEIETVHAPEYHDAAEAKTAIALAGEAVAVQMAHERHGLAELHVRLQSLDLNGGKTLSAMSGAKIQLYRVDDDGAGMTHTGIELISAEDGTASVYLAPGEYVARADADGLSAGSRAPHALRFAVQNGQNIEGELVFMDAVGGVKVRLTGGELTNEQLAQMRFVLLDADGKEYELTMQDGAFYAGGLVSGTYVLRQTQIPQGYTLADERTIGVAGGEITEVNVALEEYAVLTVSKTGLTFDDALKTYIVPLSGEYGVYTMEDGEMKPYPSEGSQMTVWANVTPEQMQQGKAGSLRLPASAEGTTYYLHELGHAQGFGADDTYYEVRLFAGEDQTLSCAVSSDRGFFSLEQLQAATGMHLSGGRYQLLDARTLEEVLAFEMGESAYRNTMAIPVGTYLLRHVEAAPGYALSSDPEQEIVIEPYLTQGGTLTEVTMTSAPIPQTAELSLIADVYAAREQGLTLVTVDTSSLGLGETLLAPMLTMHIGAQGDERSNIVSVVISGCADAKGTPYAARVEYCLNGGGWQPSDARMTGVLSGPTAVSLADVTDDISAVRVTYINTLTGEEAVLGGFAPGQVTLSVQASAAGDVNMYADVSIEGAYAYRSAQSEPETVLYRSDRREYPFVMQADGVFTTVCAGRDGRISGVAFFDEDADGVMDASETGRYAGLTVSLLSAGGDVVDSCRTGSDGSYVFSPISGGTYSLQFDAGENVVFSHGDIFSAHAVSGVENIRYGTTAPISIDGDHTDYIVHVGCIYASGLEGGVIELTGEAEHSGYAGLSVELRDLNASADEEPFVNVTDGMGKFAFSRILPGEYELSMQLPQGYLCSEATEGRIIRKLQLVPGETADLGSLEIEKQSGISGRVLIDDDGDGVIAEGAAALADVQVVLLSARDGHTEEIARTVTDADGAYAFDALSMGEYSVLFELSGQWAFTRYGEDSLVYGAVSQSGSTKRFALVPGQMMSGVDAGVTIPAQMTVSVFKDTQYDGQKGAYEEMLEGVSISLIRLENGEDAEEITYRTNEEGTVVFAGISPGEYVIAYQMPGQWRATKQVDPATTNYRVSGVPQSAESAGRSEPFTLTMGQSGVNFYIGAMLSGSVSGVVYYDDNADAQMDPHESACADVDVELLSADGEVVAKVKPDEYGGYAFEGLAPGRYRVRFTADDMCGFSGTERTIARGGVQESDDSVSTTRIISVANGSATESADAGVVRLGSLTGVIFEDSNADQIVDDTEKGMAGISVSLMNSTARTVLKTVTTNENGQFVFDRMRPGTYVLRADAPKGYVFSGAVSASALPFDEQRSGRGYSAAFTMLGGARVQGVGFGMLTQGTVDGRIWLDSDYDGRMNPDDDGLRGARVALIDAQGRTVKEMTTIRSGEFAFDQMMPGEYSLSVTLPEGYVFTTDGGDSIAPANRGENAVVDLGMLDMGGAISDVRIGALRPASVGGAIWLDEDDDGRRQTQDQPVAGVRAILEMISGADSGTTLETISDADGVYRFDGVMPGEAKVTFILEDGHAFARNASGSRRVSFVPMADSLTSQTNALDIASGADMQYLDVGVVGVGTVSGMIWEDREYDGKHHRDEAGVMGATVQLVDAVSGRIAAQAETDESGAYAIPFARKGMYTVRVTLPQGMIFTRSGSGVIADVDSDTADTSSFALAMGEGREGLNVGAIAPAHMTGRMIVDVNEDGVCGADEPGFHGAVVTVMQGGTVVATAQTQEDGGYAFDMLRPGTYRLRFATGEEALFAENGQLKLADADAGEGETGEYTLEMGSMQAVDDVAVVRASKIAGEAWVDTDVSGTRDDGEEAMQDVTAELLDAEGHVLRSAVLDGNGRFVFPRLRSGAYAVRFKLAEDMLFTDYLGSGEGSSVPVVSGHVGVTDRIVLAQGETRDNVNVGGILPGEIGDTVWLDKDGNGLQDYREPLVPGVSLTLMKVENDGQMTQAAQTQSDKYGYYSFELLRPGTYVLKMDVQEGDTLTYHFGEPLFEIDSDLDPDTGMSEPFRLSSGQVLRNVDVGLIERAGE